MRHLVLFKLAAVALAACGGQPAEGRATTAPATSTATAPAAAEKDRAAAPPGDCGEAALAMASLLGEEVLSRASRAERGEWRVRFHDLVVEICSEDRWTREATSCLAAATDSAAIDGCSSHLSRDASDRLIARIEAFVATIPTTPTRAAGLAKGSTGLDDCDRFVAVVETYIACDALPEAAADATRQGVDAMLEGLEQLRDAPEEARQAAAEACRQGLAAIEQSAAAFGCAL